MSPVDEPTSAPVVIKASREEDPNCLPAEVEKKVKIRLGMTWAGGIATIFGGAVAILSVIKEPVDVKLVIIGLVTALIGAGSVDPSLVINFIRGNGGK